MSAPSNHSEESATADLTSTYSLRPTLISFWALWLGFFIAAPLCAWAVVYFEEAGIPALTQSGIRPVIWLPMIVPLFIFWKKYNVRYVMTEDTVTVARGLLSLRRVYNSTTYASIVGAEARQSIIGMLFNYADITMGTADTSVQELPFRGIKNWKFYLMTLKARIEHARQQP